MRAREFWLVTFLRQHEGQNRLFWGTIDWMQARPELQEIRTADDLEAAFYVVGLK